MKTKKVRLYADLETGWHDRFDSDIYVWATTKPYSPVSLGQVRVAVEVELPELPREHGAEMTVGGVSVPVPNPEGVA
jgi:hypothetical protein